MKKVLVAMTIFALIVSFSIVANAADAVNITISGDLIGYVKEFFSLIKSPLETAFSYFISYLQYFAGWIASFF